MAATHFAAIGMHVLVIGLTVAVHFVAIWVDSGFSGDANFSASTTLWEAVTQADIVGISSESSTIPIDDYCALTSQLPDGDAEKCDTVKASRATVILATAFSLFAIGGIGAAIGLDNDLILSTAAGMASLSLLCHLVTIALLCAVRTDTLEGAGFILLCISTGLCFICCCITSWGFFSEMMHLHKLVKQSGITKPGDADGSNKPVGTRAQRVAKKREEDHAEFLKREAAVASMMQRNVLKDGIDMSEAPGDSRPTTQEGQEQGDDEKPESGPVKRPPTTLQRVLFHKGGSEEDEIPLEDLEAAFREIDEDGSGSIDLEELVEALRLCGLEASQAATETVIKEIDKNASGDVDIHEFIEFFRHIEELDRFEKKSAARQQFLTFLLNFCFLADIIVVGVMLMLFIKMDKDEDPDNYSLMKNLLLVTSVVLGILFICVICVPILQLSLGPSIAKGMEQYELSKVLKEARRNAANADNGGGSSPTSGPRGAAWAGSQGSQTAALDMAEYSKKSYRVNIRNNELMNAPPMFMDERQAALQAMEARQASVVRVSRLSETGGQTNTRASKSSKRVFQYDPNAYKIAEGVAMGQQLPTSFSPMQVRDISVQRTDPSNLPGAPPALTDASFPMY